MFLPHKILFAEGSPQQHTQNQQALHAAVSWEGQLAQRKSWGLLNFPRTEVFWLSPRVVLPLHLGLLPWTVGRGVPGSDTGPPFMIKWQGTGQLER